MRLRLIKAAAYLLPSLFMLLVAEAVLHGHFYLTNGYLLWRGHENFSVPYVTRVADPREYALNPNYQDGAVAINANGFRGPLVSPADSLICVIGDSVPYGAGVKEGETFADYLSKRLAENGSPLKVLNAGVPSYNLRQSIETWRLKVSKFKCKVTIVNAANDISLLDYYQRTWNERLTWASARFKVEQTRKSALAYYFSRVLGAYAGGSKMSNAEVTRALDRVAEIVREGVVEMAAAGQLVILLPVQPCYYQDRPFQDPGSVKACHGYAKYEELAVHWQPLISELNARLRRLEGDNVVFYDTTALLDGHGVRETSFVDFIHFSPQGNERIAAGLYGLLKSKAVVE